MSPIKKISISIGAILLFGVALQQYLARNPGGSGNLTAGLLVGAPAENISVKANADGWNTYKNEKLGFSVQYPKNVALRGNADSDLAILTLDRNETNNKQALITLTKKKVPLGKEPYASLEEFWKDEEGQITANNGLTSRARYVAVNERTFFEVQEDNRQNNYLGAHRYSKAGDGIYEITLTMEGEQILKEVTELYNRITATFVVP